MEALELIALTLPFIVLILVICYIYFMLNRPETDQNVVHPDEFELRPVESSQASNSTQSPSQVARSPDQGFMRLNDFINRRVEVSVRTGRQVEQRGNSAVTAV